MEPGEQAHALHFNRGSLAGIHVQCRMDRGSQQLAADTAGFHIVGKEWEARAEITDFWAMVFNPPAQIA